MRIGIYAETAKDQKPTGIGLHVRELINALAEIDGENEYFLYYQRNVMAARNGFPHSPDRSNFRLRPIRFPAGWLTKYPRLWWDWYLPWVLRRDRIDIFHGPNHFLPVFARSKNVVTIHDLAYFQMRIYNHNDTFKFWTSKALERAGSVVALSENTRRDVEGLGVDPGQVRVIYGGGHVVPDNKISYEREQEVRKLFGLPERYLLFVGSLQPRKNVPFLVRAFARLKEKGDIPHGLVLAGHRDTSTQEVEDLVRKLSLTRDVIITGYVDSWQLPLLYKMSDLFVLPTRYEGFTLVTLEAMSYGIPVIATDTSSIREGVGDAAVLVGVDDDEGLAGAMRRVLTDEALRTRMIKHGKEQARKFTWEQCARDTLALYRDMYHAQDARIDPTPRDLSEVKQA